ncbi:6-phospho-3-hexuloisomerase [Amphibacillus marinus]|uniref:6-phospho-3-hexuloisomerase n=1 Tax=Amphibacillus marinus TaxID=872970 RepID=A0A1H8LDW3_9BACI|nr:6-phospho-3-hexuloisomerase [Amphibacillus marinus]SEO03307.1 6-phospho-3-hexuloisomerase [Amphibacillus marinus]
MNELTLIVTELEQVFKRMNTDKLTELTTTLLESQRIFVTGEGRSGLMAKAFAMRLMHLGATVYVVGETTTPALTEADTLIALSGSGETKATLWAAQQAELLGSTGVAITANNDSSLAKVAQLVLHVPSATKHRNQGELESVQPLGSLFDQSVHLLLDAICLIYANKIEGAQEQAIHNHSNLE